MGNDKSANNWKRIAVEQLKAGRIVTDIRGVNKQEVPYVDYPNYDVFAYNPNLQKNPDDKFFISGTESQIILQSSLLTALYEILGKELGYGIDFDIWFQDFSYEFKVDPITGKYRDTSNSKNVLFWGKPSVNRPDYKWIDLGVNSNNRNNKNNNPNYKVIKFWKDRKLVNDFIYYGGTESEIRNWLMMLMLLDGIGSDNDKPDKKIFTELKQLSSCPVIYLLFREENTPDGENPLEAKTTLALIDCVENSKFKARPSDKVLGVPELKQYKKLIEQNFLPSLDNPYVLQKGHETYTYANWRQGYHTWLPFLNRSSAIEFYTKMCNIKGDTFDDINLYEGRVSPKKTDKPDEYIYTFGEQVKLPKYRRKGDCKFWKAYLWLPNTRQKITLVSRSRRDPVDHRLL